MRSVKPLARRLASREGAEIAEAAVVLPLVFMLLLGIIWFGRTFNIYGTIAQAAQQGAILAARPTWAGGGSGPTFPTDQTVDNQIAAVMRASSIDPTQIPPNSNAPSPVSCVNPPMLATCTNTNNITICRQVLLNAPASATMPSQCGVIVSFQYPFQFFLPFTSLNMLNVVMTAQAQSRMEN
jgi:Flp pilus assembly protein TadG